jgi:glycosyltransferase involved in cell wall biosynthesis
VARPRAGPLRVLYYYGSQHIDSGSPKALIGLIDLLDRTRVAPLFLASGEGPLVEVLQRRGVEIIRGPKARPVSYHHPIDGLARARRYARLLAAHDVDLLHVNEFGWNLDLVLAAPLRRIPVILQMHLPDSIARQNLHRFVARRVLLVSEAQKEAVRHFDRIREKTDVMYNAVDLARFAGGKSLRAELQLGPEDIVVGSLAQLRHGKGIDVLLGVARALLPRHPRLVFLVAGRLGHGEEEFGRAMMAEATAPEFGGRFRFLGSRDDVPDLLATFDVFVLATRAETFGIAVVEAMAAGVPVIASRVGAIPEIIPSSEIGRVVDTVDVPAFTRAIEAMITLPDLGRGIGARGKESLIGRFDGPSLSARLHDIYDRVGGG